MNLKIGGSDDEALRTIGRARPVPPLAPTVVLATVLTLCFVFLAGEMMEGDLVRFDTAILMAFRTAGNDPIGPAWLQEMGRDVTALGSFALLTRATADWRIRTYFMTLAVILTVAVGISRIYLAVHYPSDVLAGWCVGCAWAALCWTIGLRLQQRGELEAPMPSGKRIAR